MSWPTTTAPAGRADHPDERRADRPRHAAVELVGHDAADVVRLDDVGQVGGSGTRASLAQAAASSGRSSPGRPTGAGQGLRVLSSTRCDRQHGAAAVALLLPGAVLAAVAGGELRPATRR